MNTDDTVQSKARNWARDAQKANDLTDAEAECLRSLLKDSEAFNYLVTAQQAAVYVDDGSEQPVVDERIKALATEAAEPLGEAIDDVIDKLAGEAQEIVALAETVDDNAPWGVLAGLYQAGYDSERALQEASQEDLIEAGAHPNVAARIKAELGNDDDREVIA